MSNESFWKTVQKRICPTDKEPPSVWTLMIIVVLLVGVALWLLGVPWQATLPIALILLLLAIGGQKLSKKLRKMGIGTLPPKGGYYYSKPITPAEETKNRWIWFWVIALLIPLYLLLHVLQGLIEKYDWPIWLLSIPVVVMLLILVLWSGMKAYLKRSKKTNMQKQTDEQNTPTSFNKGVSMNEGPIRPTNNPDEQERKRRALKVIIPSMCLGIVGLALWVLSFSLDVAHTVSILMMTIGGLCWGISGALSLRVILNTMQVQQQGTPSQEQLRNNQSKIKWLSIAVIVLFTAGMFIASLCIFSSGD